MRSAEVVGNAGEDLVEYGHRPTCLPTRRHHGTLPDAPQLSHPRVARPMWDGSPTRTASVAALSGGGRHGARTSLRARARWACRPPRALRQNADNQSSTKEQHELSPSRRSDAPGDQPPSYNPPPGGYGSPPPGYNPPPGGDPYGMPPQTSNKAVWALVTGLLGLVCCGFIGIAGIILGGQAKTEIASRRAASPAPAWRRPDTSSASSRSP